MPPQTQTELPDGEIKTPFLQPVGHLRIYLAPRNGSKTQGLAVAEELLLDCDERNQDHCNETCKTFL